MLQAQNKAYAEAQRYALRLTACCLIRKPALIGLEVRIEVARRWQKSRKRWEDRKKKTP